MKNMKATFTQCPKCEVLKARINDLESMQPFVELAKYRARILELEEFLRANGIETQKESHHNE